MVQRCYPDHLDSPDDDALAAAYAWPSRPRTESVLRANMVASIDAGATVDGKSAGLGSAADQRLFAVLRDLAEVILVGAGTIRAEGYGGIRPDAARKARRSRWGLDKPAPIAVVSARGLQPELGIFTDHEVPPIVITTSSGAELMAGYPATIVVADAGPDSSGTVDLSAMVTKLADLGLHRVLCEGGPGLLGRLIAADLLDELCLTTSPLTVGAAAVKLLGDIELPDPVGWCLGTVHIDGNHLFSRYSRAAG
jgi:riboflavin biosynthesis pyrimidine reductase